MSEGIFMNSLTNPQNIGVLKKEYIERSIYEISMSNSFYSGLLQELNIRYSNKFPTACLTYDKKEDQFVIDINFDFFHSFQQINRTAILFHEILHFSHQHIFRFMAFEKPDTDRLLMNIAADMSINQFIKGLPEDSIDVNKYKLSNGNPFPLFQTMEKYYDLLTKNKDANEEELSKYGAGSGKEGQNGPTDHHQWDELSEDEKQRMLKEAKKVLVRTIEKTSNSHSLVPDTIKDLLEKIDLNISSLNYKKILQETVKKTLCVADRKATWNRPNKRYGVYAPGSTVGNLPKIGIYIDTSGSISYTELNQFLQVLDGFLKVGAKQCELGLWNTELYFTTKYRRASEFQENWIQSGGTDIKDTLKHIEKQNVDLSIILTDGYFDAAKTKCKNLLWVISENGSIEHPMKKIGKTILLKGIIK